MTGGGYGSVIGVEGDESLFTIIVEIVTRVNRFLAAGPVTRAEPDLVSSSRVSIMAHRG